MTQTLDEVQKQFTILYKDAYPTQIMYSPSGGKIFVPRIQQTTVQCSPELVCQAPLTALSDTNPHHGFMTWFRLRDIPNTMNKLKFPIAAQLANKWFETDGANDIITGPAWQTGCRRDFYLSQPHVKYVRCTRH